YPPSIDASFHSLPRPPPPSTLFPYTTLFRSGGRSPEGGCRTRAAWLAGRGRGSPRRRPGRSGPERTGRPRRTRWGQAPSSGGPRSEEHTSELQSRFDLVCRLLLEKKKLKYRW